MNKTEEFIKKAIEKHGDRYDYSKVEYKSYHSKIIIICKEHCEFEQEPANHLQYKGCIKCSISSTSNKLKKTNDEFIKEAVEKHGEKYDYSKVNYINAKTKIIIICKIHGEFEQIPGSHTQGMGCRKCGRIEYSKNKTKTTENFIEEGINKYNDKFDYSISKYNGINNKITIICTLHGEFITTPYTHLKGDGGCKKCQINKSRSTFSFTKEEFIKKSKEIHGDEFDYSKVQYVNYRTKIIIICKVHGEFEQTPNEHLSGCKCGFCKGNRISLVKRDTKEEFIIKAVKLHGHQFDYSKINYINNYTKINIICKVHGEFEQRPNSHLNGSKCNFCTNKKTHSMNSLLTLYPNIANEYDNDKNDMNITEIYAKTSKKVWWKCINNHSWYASVCNRTRLNRGCGKCNSNHSKMQIQWLNYLQISHPHIIQHAESDDNEFRIPNTRYYADGYCQETNTIYEFHGDFWHGNPKLFNKYDINSCTKTTYGELYNKTQKKKQVIIAFGYNYVEMWEYDWKIAIKAIIKIQRLWRKK